MFKKLLLNVQKSMQPKMADPQPWFPKQPSPMPTATPTATPTPTPKPYQHNIPTGNPNQPQVPEKLKQMWMEELDPYGVATSSAQAMSHNYSQTYTPEEVRNFGRENWSWGENPYFKEGTVYKNNNGTKDLGMTQVNSGTFKDMMKHPFWGPRLRARGITSQADLMDTRKNLRVHATQLEEKNWNLKKQKMKDKPSYMGWFSAPLKLRAR